MTRVLDTSLSSELTPPSPPDDINTLAAALDLLSWFSTRDWTHITHQPEIAAAFTYRSTVAALLVEKARASLSDTPIVLCCHTYPPSDLEGHAHDHVTS